MWARRAYGPTGMRECTPLCQSHNTAPFPQLILTNSPSVLVTPRYKFFLRENGMEVMEGRNGREEWEGGSIVGTG